MISWWGPDKVPNDHILTDAKENEINSVVCFTDQEDTMITDLQSTGWIKLLSTTHQKVVADIYSTSGRLWRSVII